jgi:MFS family permease
MRPARVTRAGRFNPRTPRLSVSVVFVAVMFMTIMDATVVNVTLPTLRHQFGVSAAAVSAVVTSYLVAVTVVMPASGWLADRIGGKRLLGGVIVDGLSWRWIFYVNVPAGVAALAFGAGSGHGRGGASHAARGDPASAAGPGRVPPGVRGRGRRDGVRVGHRVPGQGRRRGRDDGPRGRAGARRARPPLSAALSWRGD